MRDFLSAELSKYILSKCETFPKYSKTYLRLQGRLQGGAEEAVGDVRLLQRLRHDPRRLRLGGPRAQKLRGGANLKKGQPF